ncbi:MAG: hypothetical protein ACYTEX_25045, partial [Planctomycetota bacterium]
MRNSVITWLCFSLVFQPWLMQLAYGRGESYDENNSLLETHRQFTHAHTGTAVDACTTYTYGDANSRGSPNSVTGPDGLTRYFGYDKKGNQYKSWYHWADANDPNTNYGTVTNLTYYDAAGRVKKAEVEDENGEFQPTYYEYDTAGRQSAVIDALGYRTEYEYQGHRRILTRDACNNVTRFIHDALGRVIETEYPDGQSAHKRYSSLGNVTY